MNKRKSSPPAKRRAAKRRTVRSLPNDAGFTLVEVLISMAILAIVSIPMLSYFSDSLRYSALMAQRQKATLLSQQITEDLLAEEQLIQQITALDGTVSYSIPYLDGHGDTNCAANNLDAGTGKGSITYVKADSYVPFTGSYDSSDSFDFVIEISTDTEVNERTRSMFYGIDDTTDAIAMELDQKNEALTYFIAKNSSFVDAYVLAHPDDDDAALQAAGVKRYTSDEILEKMTRVVNISISGSAGGYLVSVSYTYSCIGLQLNDDGTPITDTITTSKLANAILADLKNIYLLYDRMEGKNDEIYLSSSAVFSQPPTLFLVCQNTDICGIDYKVTINHPLTNQTVRTNISNTAGVVQTGTVVDDAGTPCGSPLAESGTPIRIVSIQTKIYKKGGYLAGEEPLAQMETTKGE
jgi:prepilin-type N-terminal cleavage/methylation domain-containing protein